MDSIFKRVMISDIEADVEFWIVESATGSFASMLSVYEPTKFTKAPVPVTRENGDRDYLIFNTADGYSFASELNIHFEHRDSSYYNMNAAFLSRSDAEEYVDMINSNQLPDEAKTLRDYLVSQAQFRRDNSNEWDY